MARPLRIEYPGAMYHVMNRGNQRKNVFRKKANCETFLEKLSHWGQTSAIDFLLHMHYITIEVNRNLGTSQ